MCKSRQPFSCSSPLPARGGLGSASVRVAESLLFAAFAAGWDGGEGPRGQQGKGPAAGLPREIRAEALGGRAAALARHLRVMRFCGA